METFEGKVTHTIEEVTNGANRRSGRNGSETIRGSWQTAKKVLKANLSRQY